MLSEYAGGRRLDAAVVVPPGSTCTIAVDAGARIAGYAFLHRPMWDPVLDRPTGVTDPRHSIWVSFAPVDAVAADLRALVLLDQHRPVAQPMFPFESTKIGAGPPPIRVPEGWLLLHHGVSEHDTGGPVPRLDYAAGAMLLDADDVTRVRYRTSEPLPAPGTTQEQAGVDRHIVFPSGLARIGDADYLFYGVSDRYIGVAVLERAAAEPGVTPWQAVHGPAISRRVTAHHRGRKSLPCLPADQAVA